MTKKQEEKVKWSDIDKRRFYGIGTVMYTAITLCLHPITVLKTRQQVLSNSENTLKKYSVSHTGLIEKTKIYYRGVGIILLSAIPARGMYIGVLENSREMLSSMLTKTLINQSTPTVDEKKLLPVIASISGGLSGGLAAMASQSIIVPMDVVSQRQMVMDSSLYKIEGNALSVIRKIIKSEGYVGFYKGFGMSLFTSLPTGTLWWATYSGCQQLLQNFNLFDYTTLLGGNFVHSQTNFHEMSNRGFKQGFAGLSAAIVAATMTQPFDVVKTRLQVGSFGNVSSANGQSAPVATYKSVCVELYSTHGVRGFFRGVNPRILSMSLWGTVLSSAYEYLRYISRKDYVISNTWITSLSSRPFSSERLS